MPGNLQHRLSDIEGKARLLAERYRKVEAQRDAAYAKIEQLSSELTQSQALVEALKADVERLQLAGGFESMAGGLEQSRKFISELVWEIDKCINQLND